VYPNNLTIIYYQTKIMFRLFK